MRHPSPRSGHLFYANHANPRVCRKRSRYESEPLHYQKNLLRHRHSVGGLLHAGRPCRTDRRAEPDHVRQPSLRPHRHHVAVSGSRQGQPRRTQGALLRLLCAADALYAQPEPRGASAVGGHGVAAAAGAGKRGRPRSEGTGPGRAAHRGGLCDRLVPGLCPRWPPRPTCWAFCGWWPGPGAFSACTRRRPPTPPGKPIEHIAGSACIRCAEPFYKEIRP